MGPVVHRVSHGPTHQALQHSLRRDDASAGSSHNSMALQTAHTQGQLQAAPGNRLQLRRQQQIATCSKSGDTSAAESQSVPLHEQQKQQYSWIAALQLAHGNLGPSFYATYTRQSTARYHLHQYLAHIVTMGLWKMSQQVSGQAKDQQSAGAQHCVRPHAQTMACRLPHCSGCS